MKFIFANIDYESSILDSVQISQSREYLYSRYHSCIMVFFDDQTLLAPVCFNAGEYTIYDFINTENIKRVYSPKYDWGRYKIKGDTIYTEVVKPWYNPAAHFETRYDTLVFINDSTIQALPDKHIRYIGGIKKTIESDGYLNSLKNTFYKIDSINLDFLNPSKAWINN